MSAVSQVTHVAQHPASVDAYIRHGFSLVPIPQGTKGPRTAGWNLKENALRSQSDLPHGYGIGLAHAYSGTCAIDIDSWSTAVGMLALQGIDLQALYDANDAVIVDSGRAGHGKLLYKLDTPLPSKRISIDGTVVYELRCATSNGLTTQDVLPPSIHPITLQPYQWAGKGHWTRLPHIPKALLDLWQGMLTEPSIMAPAGAMTADWSEIESALESIPADCSREDWVVCGMALHWASTQISNLEQGLHLWMQWSKTAETKFPGEREILAQWNSFKPDKATGVKLGSLFKIAKEHGWTRPPIDVAGLFTAMGTAAPATPESMLNDMRPKPPVMDISLWPTVLARRATEIGETVGCDPLVPLFAGLATACGAVDARSRLEILPGFKVPPVLWLMTIGAPADKKTPGSTPMFAPLRLIEEEDRIRFAKDLLDWEGKEAAYASSKKAFLEFRASPEAMLGGQAPSVPDLDPQPVPLRLTVDDVTSQKLARMCADRPRGLLCALDEMNSWVRKMTDKQSGEDRSCWTKSYESAPYEMDRVGSGSIRAENMAVSIYGNIQPRVFQEHLHSLSADGMIQRFIPCVLNGDMTRKPKPIPEFLQNTGVWEQTIRIIYAMPAMTYTMTPEAFKVYDQFQDWYLRQRDDERLLQSDDTFMTAFGKMEGLCGRLSLMFHMLESPFNPQVSAATVDRVCEIIKGYVIPALRYALDSAEGGSFDEWAAEWVIQHCDDGVVDLPTFKHAARNRIGKLGVWQQDQAVYSAMIPLERDKWVLRLDDKSGESKHQAQWALNPALANGFAEHRMRVINAKQRRVNFIYRDSPNPAPAVHGYVGG
jgi:hypothetical protein